MIGRVLFLSAVAMVAYRYITRSNKQIARLSEPQGSVTLLPSEPPVAALTPSLATEAGRPARVAPRLSAAAEDPSRR
ncbi:MAG: hypothetical protein H7Y20_07520 [Bryobacteraceae bacterium]|nr:hypothetical protein [Bryobacteraceae bacterium]